MTKKGTTILQRSKTLLQQKGKNEYSMTEREPVTEIIQMEGARGDTKSCNYGTKWVEKKVKRSILQIVDNAQEVILKHGKYLIKDFNQVNEWRNEL